MNFVDLWLNCFNSVYNFSQNLSAKHYNTENFDSSSQRYTFLKFFLNLKKISVLKATNMTKHFNLEKSKAMSASFIIHIRIKLHLNKF